MATGIAAGGSVRSLQLHTALLLVRCAAALLPDAQRRIRYLEQWQADVHGAAELGLSPVRLALGAAAAAIQITTTTSKGSTVMPPIGPLALALRIVGGSRVRQRAAALAVLSTITLLGGVVMLITG